MTYNERKTYNMALADIYERIMPDKLTETIITELQKPVKEFRLTNEAMIANCPSCEQSWRGQSFYKQYKAYYDKQEISPTDEELGEIIKKRHQNTHSSLLFHIIEADKYVCPFCASVFEKES